jgi:two-component system chemotaxis response regulator CheY
MIVDDAAFMRGSLRFIIESAGHKVVGEADDGKKALALYKECKPDMVTLDILMKDGDGIFALGEIMTHSPDAKVVMVTAMGQESMVEKAHKIGALGYIRKPFKRDDIISEINKVVGP